MVVVCSFLLLLSFLVKKSVLCIISFLRLSRDTSGREKAIPVITVSLGLALEKVLNALKTPSPYTNALGGRGGGCIEDLSTMLGAVGGQKKALKRH
jgi:hypothetical protein